MPCILRAVGLQLKQIFEQPVIIFASFFLPSFFLMRCGFDRQRKNILGRTVQDGEDGVTRLHVETD